MKKEIICVVCPNGCLITVEGEGERIGSIQNYKCARGLDYAKAEFVNPCRTLTSSVQLEGASRRMLPVRSSGPIPRGIMLACMEQIKQQKVHSPVEMHQVIISDILGTGQDIIACMRIEQEG